MQAIGVKEYPYLQKLREVFDTDQTRIEGEQKRKVFTDETSPFYRTFKTAGPTHCVTNLQMISSVEKLTHIKVTASKKLMKMYPQKKKWC